MDVRHESSNKVLLNHLIQYMNNLIHHQTDTLVKDEHWQQHLVSLSKAIYLFTGMNVDYDHIWSNKNLLSIDVVLLPEVHDVDSVIMNNQERFNTMVSIIISELKTGSMNAEEVRQKEEMMRILEKNY